MKKLLTIFILISYVRCYSQTILRDANTILVKNVSFIEVCNALLDSGYSIEKKDADLQTVRTEVKNYPKYWNATYIINIRVKDSTAYISGIFSAPPTGGLFKDEPITNVTNKKGIAYPKSLAGSAFNWLNQFALGFKKEINYLKN